MKVASKLQRLAELRETKKYIKKHFFLVCSNLLLILYVFSENWELQTRNKFYSFV